MIQGFQFMVIGMSGVFLFLLAMVIVMKLTSGVIQKYSHLFPEESDVSSQPAKSAVEDVEIAVAIATAYSKSNK